MKKLEHFLLSTVTWSYQLLFFVTPLLFTWFNEELFEFNKMLFAYAVALVVGGCWLAHLAVHRRLHWKKTIFDIPLGLFVLSQLFSTLFSMHPWTSIFGYYTRFHGGLLSTFAYVTLFVVFIQMVPRQRIWDFLKTLAISSIIVSLIAIPEHFGRSFSCVLINSSHLAETQPLGVVLAPDQLWNSYNAQCWIQDVQTRVFATFGQPNWLAAFAITLIPLFSVLAVIRKKVSEQTVFGIASVALFLSLLFTKSRSGIIGLAIGSIWFVGLAAVWFIKYLDRKKRTQEVKHLSAYTPIAGGILACILLSVALFGTPYTPSLSQLLQPSAPAPVTETPMVVNRLDEGGTDSGEIRKIVWTGAVKVWQRYPIFGSGVETFAYSYYKDRPMEHNTVSEWDFLYNKAHNEFLNFLATTGIVGLGTYVVLLVVLIGYPAWSALTKKEQTTEERVMLWSISAGLVALTISNALGFSTVMVTVLLFLLPAIAWKLNQPTPTVANTQTPSHSADDELTVREWVWPGVIALAILVGMLLIWRTWRADYLLAQGKKLNQSQNYSDGIEALEHAYEIGGSEGIFAEELGETYSWLSAAFADAGEATAAAMYRQAAVMKANEMMATNPNNLNFYKTKTRILATLSPQDPELLNEAESVLNAASELAPTDPKVRYNLGLIKLSVNNIEGAQTDFEQSVQMKPNYEEARTSLAKLYLEQGKLDKALEQYQYILDKIQPANIEAQQEVVRIQQTLATASATPRK